MNIVNIIGIIIGIIICIFSLYGIYTLIKQHLHRFIKAKITFEPRAPSIFNISVEETLLAQLINDFRQFNDLPAIGLEAYHQRIAFESNFNFVNNSNTFDNYDIKYYESIGINGLKALNLSDMNLANSRPIDIFRKLEANLITKDTILCNWKYIGISVIRDNDTNEKYITIVLSR